MFIFGVKIVFYKLLHSNDLTFLLKIVICLAASIIFLRFIYISIENVTFGPEIEKIFDINVKNNILSQ